MNSYPQEAVTGGSRNSRKESFHFVFVHRVLSRMTKSRRELAWNIARIGELGNIHRMLWRMKRIFTSNLDERRSTKIICTVSLLEIAPLENCLPSGSSHTVYQKHTLRLDPALGIEGVRGPCDSAAVAMHVCTIHMQKRVAARMCRLKFKRKFPVSPVPHGKTVYK
jgi:hypothetical protein